MNLTKLKNSLQRNLAITAAVIAGTGMVSNGWSDSAKPAAAAESIANDAGFGGFPTLGANDDYRHLFKPYDLVKLNVLGINYCENLLDMRFNSVAYTYRGFDKWNLCETRL